MAGFWDNVKAAFNARPKGMFVPPNWVGLGAFAILGALNPGFWIVGAGLELAYLVSLASSRRFQRTVEGSKLLKERQAWQEKLQNQVSKLSREDQERYRALEHRCRTILEQQQTTTVSPSDLDAQAQGLGRLLWIYLRLLVTRQAIVRVLRDSASVDVDPLERRLARLQKQLRSEAMDEDLRKSLTGQMEIIQQRMERHREARQKLAFLEAELDRIEEQAELIREQAVLTHDPAVVSHRIDEISATLGGTTNWIQEQQRIYGRVEDLLNAPPPVVVNREAVSEA